MFEKGFLQDVRHNLWEILSGWGRRSGLRQLNSGKIYRKVGRADCRNDFSNTLWYAEAFRSVQSDSQTSEWYIYFENDVPDTKKACRNICRVELICYIWLINECLIFLYKKLWNGSPSQSSDTTFIHTKNQLYYHLLPSRLYCRPRNLTGSCLSARGLYRR